MKQTRERRDTLVSDHPVKDKQRLLLPGKPTRDLEVLQVLGDEWELIDSRGNRFVRVLNGKEDTWYRYSKTKTERPVGRARTHKQVRFCCPELRRAWGKFIDIGRLGPSTSRMPRITIFDKKARSITAIHFCPFCGKELQLDE